MNTLPTSRSTSIRPMLTRHDIYRSMLSDLRAHYQGVLLTLSAADWERPAYGTKWNIGEAMVYLYLRIAALPPALEGIRMGKGYQRMPFFLRDYILYWQVKTNAPRWNPATLAAAYDEAHRRALLALAQVGTEEWFIAAEVWGECDTTIEALFRAPCEEAFYYLNAVRARYKR